MFFVNPMNANFSINSMRFNGKLTDKVSLCKYRKHIYDYLN